MSSKQLKCLYWFRTDLRLHDSPALTKLLELNPVEFYPVWCWDPTYVYKTSVGPNRWQFLLDSMNDLSESIKKLNDRSKLFVIRGDPLIVLPFVWKRWGITHIGFEEDDDNRYSKPRDKAILELAKTHGIQSIVRSGHTLYSQDELLNFNKNQLPKTYQSFLKVVEKFGKPEKPLESPKSIPDPGPTNLSLDNNNDELLKKVLKDLEDSLNQSQSSSHDLNKKFRVKDDNVYDKVLSGPNGKFDVPTMDEMGVIPATSPHRGGETEALKKLEKFLSDKRKALTFEKPKTSPAEFNPASTTVLSPHLKFGTLSARLFYYKLIELQDSNPKIKTSTPPESLIGQLIWREFFHLQQSKIENFHQVKGNPICRFFDWRLKDKKFLEEDRESKNDKSKVDDGDEDYEESKRLFFAWRDGMTGFPWIDAIMRQLKSEGWIHHLARHSVACFLTRGNLYISWERGAEVFDELLIDWDPSLNPANWLWLSASAYFQQYFRVYSPIQFAKKWDEEGNYIKKYCPELKKFPKKFIYQPWEAPIELQKKCECIIGKDYPKPIVDDKKSKEECIEKMKEGFKLGFFGDHPKVLANENPIKSKKIHNKTNSNSSGNSKNKDNGDSNGDGKGKAKKNKLKDDENENEHEGNIKAKKVKKI